VCCHDGVMVGVWWTEFFPNFDTAGFPYLEAAVAGFLLFFQVWSPFVTSVLMRKKFYSDSLLLSSLVR